MAESEYIKIRRADLQEALLAAFEAGWIGTPEVAESVVLTIIAGMASTIAPAMDEGLLIKKLSNMIGSKEFKKEVYGKSMLDDQLYFVSTPTPLYELGTKNDNQFVQHEMYNHWDAAN